MRQEGGEAKTASGWPPGVATFSGRFLTPGGSMSVHVVQASESQHLSAEVAIEAALFAAVTVGVGIAVGEPTMA